MMYIWNKRVRTMEAMARYVEFAVESPLLSRTRDLVP